MSQQGGMSNRAKLRLDMNGVVVPFMAPEPSTTVAVAIGAASSRVGLPTGGAGLLADFVRVAATNPCRFKFGDANVVAVNGAGAGDSYLNANYAEVYRVPDGATYIAVIQEGAVTGTVSITEMR